MWELGSEPRSSARAAITFNYGVISPALVAQSFSNVLLFKKRFVLFLLMYVYVHVGDCGGKEGVLRSLGAGVTGSCESPYGCWGLNSVLLKGSPLKH